MEFLGPILAKLKVTLNAANEHQPTGARRAPQGEARVVRDGRPAGPGGGGKMYSGAWKRGPESTVRVIALCSTEVAAACTFKMAEWKKKVCICCIYMECNN